MLVVFSRELRALFRNIIYVLCMALFMVGAAYFFIVNNLLSGYSAIHPVFSNMSLVAALTIPPVAILSIKREYKHGTCDMLDALPVTGAQVFFGKFLAVIAFFMIPTAVMAVYPIVLAFLGASNIWQGYILFVPFVFCVAFFVAMSFMIAVIAKKTWLALVVNYAIEVVLFVLGLISVLFNGAIETALKWVSPFRRFDPIVFDLFDLSSILFYISFAALFFVVALLIQKKNNEQRKKHISKKLPVGIAAVIIASTLFLNVGASVIPKSSMQLDVSSEDTYKISDNALNFLDTLDEDITVYLIDPSSNVKLETYINHFCEQSDRITLEEIDSATNAEFLKKYGLTGGVVQASDGSMSSALQYCMIVQGEKRWKFVDLTQFYSYYYAGSSQNIANGLMSSSEYMELIETYYQAIEYYQQSGSTNTETLLTISEDLDSLINESVEYFNPEQALTLAIEYVIRDYIPATYFVSNHGEKYTDSNPIDISKLDKIPQSAGSLIINDPDKDYSKSEIAALADYVDRGGHLLIFTDKNLSKLKNLSAFIETFGLTAEEGVISDDGETKIEATVNVYDSFLAGSSFSTVTVSDVNAINVNKNSDFNIVPLLTFGDVVEDEEESGDEAEESDDEVSEDDKAEAKSIAVMATTKGGAPRLVWFTGADYFFTERKSEDLSKEESQEYQKLIYLAEISTQWLKVSYSSMIEEGLKNPVPNSPAILQVSSGATAFCGFVFIGIIPFGIVGFSLLSKRMRKKRSAAVIEEE